MRNNKTLFLTYLITISLILTGCITTPGRWKSRVSLPAGYYSYQDFKTFADDFYAKSNSNRTRIFFDFDNEESISHKTYSVTMTGYRTKFLSYHNVETLYDAGFSLNCYFSIDDISESGDIIQHAHQIYIIEYKSAKEKFDEQDIIYKYLPQWTVDPDIVSIPEYLCDMNALDIDGDWQERVYNYVNSCHIFIGDELIMDISISSVEEPIEEKINEIFKMLQDNMIIYNAGDL